MSIVETLTVFVGIPALVIAVVAGLVYLSSARSNRRYRPGRPFEFTPVWFLSAAEGTPTGGSGPTRSAVEAAASADPAGSPASVKGGAHGSW